MTATEFSIWFDGFRQDIGDAPASEQWQLLCEQIERLKSDVPMLTLTYPSWSISPSYDLRNSVLSYKAG